MSLSWLQQEFSEEEGGAEKKGLTTQEEVKTGSIHVSILVAYCKACTWPMSILTFFFFLFGYAASVGGNFWLATWSNVEAQTPGVNFTQTTACDAVNHTSMWVVNHCLWEYEPYLNVSCEPLPEYNKSYLNVSCEPLPEYI